jgi:hypothetical protein
MGASRGKQPTDHQESLRFIGASAMSAWQFQISTRETDRAGGLAQIRLELDTRSALVLGPEELWTVG